MCQSGTMDELIEYDARIQQEIPLVEVVARDPANVYGLERQEKSCHYTVTDRQDHSCEDE